MSRRKWSVWDIVACDQSLIFIVYPRCHFLESRSTRRGEIMWIFSYAPRKALWWISLPGTKQWMLKSGIVLNLVVMLLRLAEEIWAGWLRQ